MLKLALVAIAIVARVEAYSEGAPVIACADFTPQHGVELQDNNEAIFDLSFPNNFQSGRVIAAGFGDASYPKLNLTVGSTFHFAKFRPNHATSMNRSRLTRMARVNGSRDSLFRLNT